MNMSKTAKQAFGAGGRDGVTQRIDVGFLWSNEKNGFLRENCRGDRSPFTYGQKETKF